jgi:uncharacterized RDD family membrane protein YckC
MTEGLDLNHFADGLPYTPASQKRANAMNSAARASGAVQPAMSAPTGSTVMRAPHSGHVKQTSAGTPSAQRLIEQFDVEAPAEPEYAGFARRAIAYVLDIALSTAMFAGIVWASFALNGYNIEQLLSERRGLQLFWPLSLLYMVMHLGYFLIQETTWSRTIGKALMGIRIRSSTGFAVLGRAVCFFIAAIPFGIGLLWYFFDSRGRCWHDVITDSEVVLN